MASQDLLLRITGDSTSAERALVRAEQAQRRYDNAIRSARSEMEADFAKRAQAEEAANAKRAKSQEQVGKAMIGIGIATAAGVGVAIAKFAEFDQGMSSVQAATHESAEGMAQLRDAALDAGAKTAFSATEAASGIEELAKAGISTADIMGGALTGALDLAAAGGIGVAEAAETTATALSIFKLEGDQAAHVADLLAAGAGKAQGSVGDLAGAMNQSALVAAQVGLSIEETSGTLALFASNGLLGSDAGTAFRSMLLKLTNPTAEAKTLMQDLGINVYNASGQFVGMEGVAGQLQDRMGNLDAETRNAALGTIFGSDAIRAASILYSDGAEGVKTWTANVNDAGFAAETAAIRLDNLKGDLEALGGSVETALIGLGEGANGPGRAIVQWATDAVNAFSGLPEGAQTAALALGAVTAAVGLLGGAALVAIPKVAATKVALTELGVTAAGTRTALGGVATALGVVGVAFAAVEIMKKVGEWTNATVAVEGLEADLVSLGKTGKASGELLDVFGSDLSEMGDRFTFATTGIDGFANKMEGNFESFEKIDVALAGLVASGNTEGAADAFDEMARAGLAAGATVEEITGFFPAYASAAEAAGVGIGRFRDQQMAAANESRNLREGMEGFGPLVVNNRDAVDDLTGAYEAQAEAVPELSDEQAILAERMGLTAEQAVGLSGAMSDLQRQQEILTGANVSAIETQSAYEAAIDSADQAFQDYKAAQDEAAKAGEDFESALLANGAGLDLGAASGRALNDELLTMADRSYANADAIFKLTGDEDAYRASLDQARTALFDKAVEYGLTEAAAKLYVDQVLAIPENRVTTVSFDDLVARAKLSALNSTLDQVLRRRTLYIDVRYTGVGGPLEGDGSSSYGPPPGSRVTDDGSAGDLGRTYGQSAQERAAGAGALSVPAGGRGYGEGRSAAPAQRITINAPVFNPVESPSSQARMNQAQRARDLGFPAAADAIRWVAV